MKVELDPIMDDEWLLRRVYVDFFRTAKVPLISPNAFEPRIKGREPDETGISPFRSACLMNVRQALEALAEERRHLSGVVQLQVVQVCRLKSG